LENFKSKQPIIAVALSAEPIRPVSQQFGLFETALRDPHQLFDTLARLTALLGAERVGTPVIEETHRPDAFRVEPFGWSPSRTGTCASDPPSRSSGAAGTAAATANGFDGRRPPLQEKPALRRFRPPQHASVFSSENAPVHVQSDAVLEGARAVEAAQGPYLLSGNWWDEKAWARAEWDLQLESGEVIRAHQAQQQWEIDGIYD
jgi:protein ImuB